MRELKVTEPEIVEVLLGGADPALETRVRPALRLRPEASALYAQWAGVLPALQDSLAPIRRMNQRIAPRVMDRLSREDPLELPRRLPQPPRRRARLLILLALLLAFTLLLAILYGALG